MKEMSLTISPATNGYIVTVSGYTDGSDKYNSSRVLLKNWKEVTDYIAVNSLEFEQDIWN